MAKASPESTLLRAVRSRTFAASVRKTRALLGAGAQARWSDKNGCNLLHRAFVNRTLPSTTEEGTAADELVHLLIEAGADPWAVNNAGVEAMSILRMLGVEGLERWTPTPLDAEQFAQQVRKGTLTHRVERYIDEHPNEITAEHLHDAVRVLLSRPNGNMWRLKLVAALLRGGVDVSDDVTAAVVSQGNYVLVQALAGTDQGNERLAGYSLDLAARALANRDSRSATLICEEGWLSPDDLLRLAVHDLLGAVPMCLELGADPNAEHEGSTPLMRLWHGAGELASDVDDPYPTARKAAKSLLDAGAHVGTADGDGHDAAWHAESHGWPQLARYLRNARARGRSKPKSQKRG